MGNIFNMDNGFWRAMGKVADIIILNILFVICCIPIVTVGASYTALYTVMLKLVKNEESYIFRGFFKAFKDNFKQATIIWLIMLFMGIFLVADVFLTTYTSSTVLAVLHYVFIAFLFVYAAMFSYVFPILSKFDNTVFNTIRNSLLMAVAHFPWTIVILVVSAVPIIACVIDLNLLFTAVLPLMLFAGFAALAFVKSHIFNKIFKRYIPEETDDTEGTDAADDIDDIEEADDVDDIEETEAIDDVDGIDEIEAIDDADDAEKTE